MVLVRTEKWNSPRCWCRCAPEFFFASVLVRTRIFFRSGAGAWCRARCYFGLSKISIFVILNFQELFREHINMLVDWFTFFGYLGQKTVSFSTSRDGVKTSGKNYFFNTTIISLIKIFRNIVGKSMKMSKVVLFRHFHIFQDGGRKARYPIPSENSPRFQRCARRHDFQGICLTDLTSGKLNLTWNSNATYELELQTLVFRKWCPTTTNVTEAS